MVFTKIRHGNGQLVTPQTWIALLDEVPRIEHPYTVHTPKRYRDGTTSLFTDYYINYNNGLHVCTEGLVDCYKCG